MPFGYNIPSILSGYVNQKLSMGTAGVTDTVLTAISTFRHRPQAAELKDAPKPGNHHWYSAAVGRPDPMLDIYWYVQLPTFGGIKLDWAYVEEAVLPFVDFDSVSNYRAGKNYHYPNHYNLNSLQLKFYGDVKGNTFSYLKAWQNLIVDTSTGLYNVPSVYKLPISITILDAAQFLVTKFTYLGCWPSAVDQVTVGSQQSGRITPTVTFQVDELIIDVIGGDQHDSSVGSAVDNINKDTPKVSDVPAFPSIFDAWRNSF